MMKYFLYRHIRLDSDEVFYIGIGKKIEKYNSFKSEYRRAFSKRRNKHWKNIVNKTDYEIDILYESDDFEIIKNKEKEFIKLYGRKDIKKGTLVNYTNGGEGTLGYIFTKEQLLKMSISHKGISNLNKGKTYVELYGDRAKDIKLLQSNSRKGKYKGMDNNFYGKKHSVQSKSKMGTSVIQYDLDNNYLNTYDTITEAANKTNSSISLIQKVCKGERNKHNGFKWKYVNIENTRMI